MEALGTISPLTSLSFSDKQQQLQQSLKHFGSTHFPNFSKIPLTRTRFGLHCKGSGVVKIQVVEEEYELKQMKDMAAAKKRWEALGSRVVKMQVVEEEYELKQMKDMAAAKKRWDALIRDGKVKVLTPREAGYAIQLSNKTLLDVRPSIERKKAWVKGSVWIPIFEADSGFDVTSLSRNISNFMMGGWWSGVPSLLYNSQFLPNVEDKFSKDTDLILACQKGLRSIAACELLYNYGYKNLFWIQGGLEAAEEEDLEREGPQPFKFAGIGGVSEFLGWTDQQRAAAAKEGWGYRLVFSARLVSLVLVADAMFIGAQQISHYLQDLRPH